jgi:hypothetical protein
MCNGNGDSGVLREELEADEFINDILNEVVSSSEEEEEAPPSWGGSRKGRAPNKPRDFAAAHAKVVGDYFNGADSIYSEADFERRFRMPRPIFHTVQEAIMGSDPFIQKTDVCGKQGIHPLVKLVACFHCLVCGVLKSVNG